MTYNYQKYDFKINKFIFKPNINNIISYQQLLFTVVANNKVILFGFIHINPKFYSNERSIFILSFKHVGGLI